MNLLNAMAGMFTPVNNGNDRHAEHYSARLIHPTKKGPSRSSGMKLKHSPAGTKIQKQAFSGIITLRNGIGAAGRLALDGKLGMKRQRDNHGITQ